MKIQFTNSDGFHHADDRAAGAETALTAAARPDVELHLSLLLANLGRVLLLLEQVVHLLPAKLQMRSRRLALAVLLLRAIAAHCLLEAAVARTARVELHQAVQVEGVAARKGDGELVEGLDAGRRVQVRAPAVTELHPAAAANAHLHRQRDHGLRELLHLARELLQRLRGPAQRQLLVLLHGLVVVVQLHGQLLRLLDRAVRRDALDGVEQFQVGRCYHVTEYALEDALSVGDAVALLEGVMFVVRYFDADHPVEVIVEYLAPLEIVKAVLQNLCEFQDNVFSTSAQVDILALAVCDLREADTIAPYKLKAECILEALQ